MRPQPLRTGKAAAATAPGFAGRSHCAQGACREPGSPQTGAVHLPSFGPQASLQKGPPGLTWVYLLYGY